MVLEARASATAHSASRRKGRPSPRVGKRTAMAMPPVSSASVHDLPSPAQLPLVPMSRRSHPSCGKNGVRSGRLRYGSSRWRAICSHVSVTWPSASMISKLMVVSFGSEAPASLDESPRPGAGLGGKRVATRIPAERASGVDGHLGRGARAGGRIEDGPHHVGHDEHVAICLHARGHCPQHFLLVEHVHVVVDHHYELESEILTESGHGRVPRLPFRGGFHGDVAVEAARPRVRIGHRADARIVAALHLEHARLLRHGKELGVLGGDAAHDVLIESIAPVADGAYLDHVLRRPLGGVAGELGERALRLARAGEDPALQHELRLGGRFHGHAQPGHDLERLPEEAARHLVLVGVDRPFPEPAPEMEERMRADHHRYGQRLAPLLRPPLIVPEMPAAVQARAHAVTPAQFHAVEARVAHAGVGVLGHYDAVGDVGARVFREVIDDGQLAKVDLDARLHHLAHRPTLAQEGSEAPLAAPHPLVVQALERHAEGARIAPAMAEHVGHHGEAGPSHLLEPQHGMLATALQLQHEGGDVVPRLDLARDAPDFFRRFRLELLEEGAQVHSSGPSHSVSMVPTPLASACAWTHAPRTISLMANPRCQKMMRSSAFSRPRRAPCTISPISACTCSRRSAPLAMSGWSWPPSWHWGQSSTTSLLTLNGSAGSTAMTQP